MASDRDLYAFGHPFELPLKLKPLMLGNFLLVVACEAWHGIAPPSTYHFRVGTYGGLYERTP